MSKIIDGNNLPNIPWQDKPKDCWLPIWRYSENPVIGRNPFPGMGRIYNSAVIPWEGKFKGVFRSEDTSARPFLYKARDQGPHQYILGAAGVTADDDLAVSVILF